MEWNQIENTKNHGNKDFVSVSPTSLYINKEGIVKHKLEDKESVSIFQTSDQMKIKMIFHEGEPPGSYKLKDAASHSKNCVSRRVSCKKVINSNQRLQKIAHLPREDRIMPMIEDPDGNIILYCAPCFEYLISVDDIKSIDVDQIGIYRCLDVDRDVLYIGSGKIRNRVTNAKQNIEEIKYVDFSIINDREEAYYWEKTHLHKYIEKHGRKPYYNKILAPKGNVPSLELVND